MSIELPTTEEREYMAVLGRQPELGMVEIEQRYDPTDLIKFGDSIVTFTTNEPFDVQHVGGTIKAGYVLKRINATDWQTISKKVIEHAIKLYADSEGKLTLGISVYGRDLAARDVQKIGLTIKSRLKSKRSVRLVPNDQPALSSATSHHNKLGLSENKVELIIAVGARETLLAGSTGTQNITALAARDQARPKTDAFVGMLPPKLALMMINMSGATTYTDVLPNYILDPFCGTGVVLQEASLLGYTAYGSDLSEKMVDYSTANMEWLSKKFSIGSYQVEHGDAIEHTWNLDGTLAAVVCETYLGQPFSAPPAPDKLQKVVRIVNDIVSKFLVNLSSQISPETPLCIAVPAWRDASGNLTHLPLISNISKLGYEWQPVRSHDPKRLLYYREDQVVARQLLILKKT